jgi:hypothetical protein
MMHSTNQSKDAVIGIQVLAESARWDSTRSVCVSLNAHTQSTSRMSSDDKFSMSSSSVPLTAAVADKSIATPSTYPLQGFSVTRPYGEDNRIELFGGTIQVLMTSCIRWPVPEAPDVAGKRASGMMQCNWMMWT